MMLLRRILVLDLAAGLVACLLMGGARLTSAQALTQLARTSTTAFFVATPIVLVLMRFGASMYERQFPANWTLLVMSILACAVAGNLAGNTASMAFRLLAPADFWNSFWGRIQFSVILSLGFGIAGFGYEILRKQLETRTLELRNRQLEQERTSKLAAEAQLASLESHVRPHFLFNTLNTISSLIPEDPKLAESLVGKLAALLRQSLDLNQNRVGPLERELKIVNDYLEIERARYGDRLRIRIDVPPELRTVEVPSLSLQTLVENSVKYAVASRFEGAEIRIAAFTRVGSVFVEVSDDGPGFTAQAIRPGHGLDNLQRRLVALFGTEARLEISREGESTVVSFRVPRSRIGAG